MILDTPDSTLDADTHHLQVQVDTDTAGYSPSPKPPTLAPAPAPTTSTPPLALASPSPPPLTHLQFPELQSDSSDTVPIQSDPPPPYPSRERRSRAGTTGSSRRLTHISTDGGTSTTIVPPYADHHDHDTFSPTEYVDDTENTPLLSQSSPRRQRTISHSTVASSHSLAQTVFSLFQAEADEATPPMTSLSSPPQGVVDVSVIRRLRRYFRPMRKAQYYKALFHLLFINFPFALVAFVLLFVGTLTGTTLLVALPLGVVISWFNFICARAFARWELALQSTFHGPLPAYRPHSPHPIFSRPSGPNGSSSALEAGQTAQEHTSFLRDTYAMFTDPISYQALFYFLVIKPSITLLLFVGLLAVVPPSCALVVPLPAVLRATKRVGAWQASIAVEGLVRARL